MINQFSGGRCDGSRVGVVSIPRYNVWNLSPCKREEVSASTFLTPGIWRALKKILFLRQIRTFSRSNPSILVPFAVFLLKSHALVIRHKQNPFIFQLTTPCTETVNNRKEHYASCLPKEDDVPARLCGICVKPQVIGRGPDFLT